MTGSPGPVFADHFSALAPAYAAARPTYPTTLFDWLGGLAPSRALAWDCAAGNGQATLPLAADFDQVIGTDASAAQLAQAPAHPRVRYRAAPADASGLAPGSVDLVTVAQAMHWLDLPAFFHEVRRVLVPRGVLAVWCYGLPVSGERRVDRALERFYHETVGPHWPPERRLVESGYRTLPFPFEELDTPAFEMAHAWTLHQLLAYVATWSATARFLASEGYDPVPSLAQALRAAWDGDTRIRILRWPLSLRVGRGA